MRTFLAYDLAEIERQHSHLGDNQPDGFFAAVLDDVTRLA